MLVFLCAVLPFFQYEAEGVPTDGGPEVLWAREYFSHTEFYEFVETPDGCFLVAGARYSENDSSYDTCLFKFDGDGELLWTLQAPVYDQAMLDIVILPDGGYAACGWIRPSHPVQPECLALLKLTSDLELCWLKYYHLPEGANSTANSMIPLPDGGFGLCGVITPQEGDRQAWILRTDSQGDTLWTREWGGQYNDYALDINYLNGGLTVLTHGRLQGTTDGPHLARFDLDGNLLWTQFISELAQNNARAMCKASDSGLLIYTDCDFRVAHTSNLGVVDWIISPPGGQWPLAKSIATTMDGGFVTGGWEDYYYPDGTPPVIYGRISRFDQQGALLWTDPVYDLYCHVIYSVMQLSQGGYLATGCCNGASSRGFLIRYAPELGIPDESTAPGSRITGVYPNPFREALSVDFTLELPGEAKLQVFDTSGRLVETITSGTFGAGVSRAVWTPGANMPRGCYLVRLEAGSFRDSKRCVLL